MLKKLILPGLSMVIANMMQQLAQHRWMQWSLQQYAIRCSTPPKVLAQHFARHLAHVLQTQARNLTTALVAWLRFWAVTLGQALPSSPQRMAETLYALLCCAVFGGVYGALAGASFGAVVGIIIGALPGFFLGMAGGIVFGILGAILGGPIGWGVAGMIGGACSGLILVPLRSFSYFIIGPSIILGFIGWRVGVSLQQVFPTTKMVRWFKTELHNSIFDTWTWEQRFSLFIALPLLVCWWIVYPYWPRTLPATSLDCSGSMTLHFSPDGRLLVGIPPGGSGAVVWSVKSARMRGIKLLNGLATPALAFSPKGTLLALCDSDERVTVWDLSGNIPMLLWTRNIYGNPTSVAFNADGSAVAVGSERGARVFDAITGHVNLHFSPTITGSVASVAFSDDGTLLSTGSHVVKIWDTRTGSLVRRIKPWTASEYQTQGLQVLFLPHSHSLAIGAAQVELWGGTNWGYNTTLDGFYDVESLQLSASGKHLVAVSYDCVRRWDIHSHAFIERIPYLTSGEGHAFSPEENILAISSVDGNVQLWSVDGSPRSSVAHMLIGLLHDDRPNEFNLFGDD